MDAAQVVERLIAVDVDQLDRSGAETVLRDVRRVHGFVEAIRLRVVARLEAIADETGNADPAASTASSGRTSRRDAERVRKRAAVAAAVPPVAAALADGEISAEHLDVLAQVLAGLEPAARAAFAADAIEIAALARSTTADEFARALRRRINALDDADRVRRFERQRRSTTLRWWLDRETGMIRLFGEFDPVSGLRLTERIARATEALFHDAAPDTCPDDPERRQGHLRALALLQLVTGAAGTDTIGCDGSTSGQGPGPATRPHHRATGSDVDLIVVVDLETMQSGLRADSRVDLPHDVELPVETLRRLACTAGIIPVVLGGEGVALDVGRRQRLATADQRRALRAMYRTCGVDPACQVPFRDCEPHHIEYWTRDLGPTDLVNLIPSCSAHHHMVHEGGWRLALRATDRRLTVTFPDGSQWWCWPDSRPPSAAPEP